MTDPFATLVVSCLLVGIIVLALLIWILLWPIRIAKRRKMRALNYIRLLVLLSVFSFGVFWCVPLVWAMAGETEPEYRLRMAAYRKMAGWPD